MFSKQLGATIKQADTIRQEACTAGEPGMTTAQVLIDPEQTQELIPRSAHTHLGRELNDGQTEKAYACQIIPGKEGSDPAIAFMRVWESDGKWGGTYLSQSLYDLAAKTRRDEEWFFAKADTQEPQSVGLEPQGLPLSFDDLTELGHILQELWPNTQAVLDDANSN